MEMKKSSSILVKNNIDKNSIDSIAIGGFDGMHIAHQELFKNLNPKGAIISIETGYASITPKNYRQEYTKYPIFYYDLEDIKALDGADFIEMLKNDFKNLKKIVVGFDFCFGKKGNLLVDVRQDVGHAFFQERLIGQVRADAPYQLVAAFINYFFD